MKAAVFEGLETISVREVPDPHPTVPFPVVVKVDACALCGSDVRTFHHGKSNVKPPAILGHEMAGTVTEILPAVRSVKVGDRVTVGAVVSCGECAFCTRGIQNRCVNFTAIGYEHPGAFAQYLAVPAALLEDGSVNRIPEGTPPEWACIAEPLACVINGQELSQVGLGQTVVVIGGGPIGCLHVALAKVRGATRVILCERSPMRRDKGKAFGADRLVDSRHEDAVEVVMDETEGGGADVVIVAAPSAEAQQQAIGMAAKRGVVNFFGGLPKDQPNVMLDANLIHYRELFVHGAADSTPRQNQLALRLIAAGRIPVQELVTHRLPLKDVAHGIELCDRREALKVVIEPWA